MSTRFLLEPTSRNSFRNWIENADLILVLIGDNWLDRDDEGRRRLDHPDDFVRLEIQAALEQGRKIVPVMVEGAAMPRATDLPESIRGLVRIQSFELSDGRWISDLERLVLAIDSARAGPSLPVTRQPPAPAPRRRVGAVIEDAPGWAKAAGTAALVGVAAVAILIVTGGSESSGGCANQTIPPDVRDRLSVAEGAKTTSRRRKRLLRDLWRNRLGHRRVPRRRSERLQGDRVHVDQAGLGRNREMSDSERSTRRLGPRRLLSGELLSQVDGDSQHDQAGLSVRCRGQQLPDYTDFIGQWFHMSR